MIEPEPPSAAAEAAPLSSPPPTPFRSWTQCEKAFKAIKPPISEETRQEFLDRLSAAGNRRYFAFRFLVDRALGNRSTKLAPFEDALMAMLCEGEPMVDLVQFESRETVQKWVADRFEPIASKEDAKLFFGRHQHIWILYMIVRAWHNQPVFAAAFSAFAKAMKASGSAKRKAPAGDGNGRESLESFVRVLAEKIPSKGGTNKGFNQLLDACRALIALSAPLADELMAARRSEQALEAAHAALQSEGEDLRSQKEQLVRNVAESEAAIASLTAKLSDEQEHFERQKGVNAELRKKMLADVIGQLRQTCLPRLENIRLFTDRDSPNKEGIIRLAGEIEEALSAPI